MEERVFYSEPFLDAFEIAYFSNLKDDDRLRYEIDLKERRDKFAIEEFQRKQFDKGLKQGLEQGLEQGKREKEIEIAKNLLKNGVDISIIKLSTQLSEDEIKSIKY